MAMMTLGRCEMLVERNPLKLLGLLLLITPVATWSQSGGAPSYITSMSDYEVRSLSGAYAPANGTSSMESITPQEWLQNDPGTGRVGGVIDAWGGGAKGIGSKLFVHGGGHNDSANNGMYTFDFSGTNAPLGWETPLVISPVSAVIAASPTYADGKPTSTHTADTLVYAHHNNHIYRFAGVWYNPPGGFVSFSFKYNVATHKWSRLPDYPGGASVPSTYYDPVSKKIFVHGSEGPTSYIFRTDTETWSGPINAPLDIYVYSVGVWDTKRNRGIIVGEGKNSVVNIDFANETVSGSPISASGAASILNIPAISATYDPQRDVYWLFGGRTANSGSGDYTTIYEMNANGPPWTVTAHKLTGDPIQYNSNMWGSYGRFILMDGWRAIGLVESHTSPVYVIKLPGETVDQDSPPLPPSDVIVE